MHTLNAINETLYPPCLLPPKKYLLMRDDLRMINPRCDATNAAALRILETRTNQRIRYAGSRLGIPAGHIPTEDHLWLDIRLSEFENYACGVRHRSSLVRALSDQAKEHEAPSLVQCGYLKTRYVAYYQGSRRPAVATRIYRDVNERPFIIVNDMSGRYMAPDGSLYHAPGHGFTAICKQYLLLCDNVNFALASLDPASDEPGWQPPPSPPVWTRGHVCDQYCEQYLAYFKQQQKKGALIFFHPDISAFSEEDNQQQTSANREDTTPTTISVETGGASTQQNITMHEMTAINAGPNGQAAPGERGTEAQPPSFFERPPSKNTRGRTRNARGAGENKEGHGKIIPLKKEKELQESSLSQKKDSAAQPLDPSFFPPLFSDQLSLAELRTAEWCPETLIGLVACSILQVPAPQAGGEQWFDDWYKPAERLIAKTRDMWPSQAWAHIERIIRGMNDDDSPAWYVQGRARRTAFTLRHVANSFNIVRNELERANWYPSKHIPYDGPPIDEAPANEQASSYEDGYRGCAGETGQAPEPITDEVPAVTLIQPDATVTQDAPPLAARPAPAPKGMSADEAYAVATLIHEEFPTIIQAYAEIAPDQFWIGIEYAPDRWLDVKSERAWQNRPPHVEKKIKRAVQFAEQQQQQHAELQVQAQATAPPVTQEEV